MRPRGQPSALLARVINAIGPVRNSHLVFTKALSIETHSLFLYVKTSYEALRKLGLGFSSQRLTV
jgi:hypothetical protein